MGSKHRIVSTKWLQAGPDAQRLLRKGWGVSRHTQGWDPPTDVYEREEGLVVQIEIAGMQEDECLIALGERLLVIEGSREDQGLKKRYYQMEIRYGSFRTQVHLPWTPDPDQVEAIYEAGFLRIFLPRPTTHRVPVIEREKRKA